MPSPEIPSNLPSKALYAAEMYDRETQTKVGLENALNEHIATKRAKIFETSHAQQHALRALIRSTAGNTRLPFMERAAWDYALQPMDGEPTFAERTDVFHTALRSIKFIDDLVQQDGLPLLVIGRNQDLIHSGDERSMLYRTEGRKLFPRYPGVSKEEKPVFDFRIKASVVTGRGNHTSGYDLDVDVPALLAVITSPEAARQSVDDVMGNFRDSKTRYLGWRATRAFFGESLTRKPRSVNEVDLAAEIQELLPSLSSKKNKPFN